MISIEEGKNTKWAEHKQKTTETSLTVFLCSHFNPKLPREK